jgi:hypothetical protein
VRWQFGNGIIVASPHRFHRIDAWAIIKRLPLTGAPSDHKRFVYAYFTTWKVIALKEAKGEEPRKRV